MLSEKNQIRARAKQFRDQLQVMPDWADEAADIFLSAVQVKQDAIVSVYYPVKSEIDPSPIVEKLWGRGVTVCLPIINADRRDLSFSKWDKSTKLVHASFGVFEPEDKTPLLEPDILIIPLLAFDQTGNRMGYGQGHYDETLRILRAKKDVLAVGLAYAEQAVLLALPAEPHDQKLDMVVTPQRVFDFRA